MEQPNPLEINKATSQLVEGVNKLLIKYLDTLNIPFRPVVILKPKLIMDEKIDADIMIEMLDVTLGNTKLYPQGVKTKSRRKRIRSIRQIGCKLMRDMEYTFEEIGKAFDIDHVTAIHGSKTVHGLLEIKDYEMTAIYKEVVLQIQYQYGERFGSQIKLDEAPYISGRNKTKDIIDEAEQIINKPITASKNEREIREFLSKKRTDS